MILTLSEISMICTKFGYTFASLGEVNSGYRNTSHRVVLDDGREVNIVAHKSDQYAVQKIRTQQNLGAQLSARGLPVRRPLDPRILSMTRGRQRALVAVYNYLPGQTIPWEAYTRTHIKLLGHAMASFHGATQNTSVTTLTDVEADYQMIVEQMVWYFSRNGVIEALEKKCSISINIEKIAAYDGFLASCLRLLHRQPLHMDFVRGNILFARRTPGATIFEKDTSVSGIIDLEKTAVGSIFFDIARTLAFLLVDCPQPAEKVRRYFLESGYIKRGQAPLRPLSVDGRDMLETLIDLFLTYDLYKFLRDNPYEALAENHHFVQTRSMLLARDLIY